MTFLPVNTLANFLDPSIILPEEASQLKYVLRDAYYRTADAVNSREISYYPLQEIVCGNFFFTSGNPQKFRLAYRKVFEVGAIATGATSTVAHGITGLVEFTHIYGTLITDVVDYRPLPFVSAVAVNQQTSVQVVGANYVIVNGAAAPNITNGILILEYLKQ